MKFLKILGSVYGALLLLFGVINLISFLADYAFTGISKDGPQLFSFIVLLWLCFFAYAFIFGWKLLKQQYPKKLVFWLLLPIGLVVLGMMFN